MQKPLALIICSTVPPKVFQPRQELLYSAVGNEVHRRRVPEGSLGASGSTKGGKGGKVGHGLGLFAFLGEILLGVWVFLRWAFLGIVL